MFDTLNINNGYACRPVASLVQSQPVQRGGLLSYIGKVLNRILSLGRKIQKAMVGVGPVGVACNILAGPCPPEKKKITVPSEKKRTFNVM